MHKKLSGFIGFGVLVITAAAVGLVVQHKDSNTTAIVPSMSLAAVRKAAPAHPDACVANTKDAAGLSVAQKDRSFIENNVVGQIDNVPAGTNVDVHLQTYTSTTATGSAIYDKPYGNYNFIARKLYPHAGNTFVGGWRITKFEVCNR